MDRHQPRTAPAGRAAAFAWAYQIVGHKCRDWLRRHRRQRQLDELYGVEVHESYGPEQEAEQYADLREALARLPGRDRRHDRPAL